jgi:signal transduction histidine kinase
VSGGDPAGARHPVVRVRSARVRRIPARGTTARPDASTREPVPGDLPSPIRTREALRFLIEASQALTSTLDYERALQTLADLAVPRVACMCAVDILQPDGRVRTLGIAHVDHARLPLLAQLVADIRETTDPPALSLGLDGEEPVLISRVTDEWLRENAEDEEEHARVRELGPTSLIFVPLVARGTRLGVLVLASSRADRLYGPGDLVLARELGRIASVAIDNARLYLQAQDAIQARDEVLRVVSHDLRNPLNTIDMGAAYLLEEGPRELRDGVFGRTLGTIVNSTRRANRMIEDLLDVARIEGGALSIERAPEPVEPIVREALETYRHAADEQGIELELRLDPPLPPVVADRDRVLQVLGNLLTNALKFTPAGGRVEVGAAAEGDEIRLWVRDNGPGLDPAHLPHLFDRFWQARRSDRRGLGLGLAIVKGLVEAHGGRVWVESAPGHGSRFQFTLPASSPAEDGPAAV